jgi:hypothetical protein
MPVPQLPDGDQELVRKAPKSGFAIRLDCAYLPFELG